jgi:hypothetical protein
MTSEVSKSSPEGLMLPKSVKIGVQVFTIEERDPKKDGMLNDGSYGYTLDGKNLIVVDSTIHITKKQVTLLHEIMHAARMVWENPTSKPGKSAGHDEWEHYFIGVWETSLLLIMRENPKLMEWLLKAS